MQSLNGHLNHIELGIIRGKELHQWVRLSLKIADWDFVSHAGHLAALQYWLDSEESE